MYFYSILKRIFDIALSIFGIVVFLPLYGIIILLIYCLDGDPIFFFQERCGKNSRVFKLAKFRTMRLADEPHTDVDLLEKDPRLTKTGRLLRATAMDELPQLVNILKGDMSFVGPKALLYIIEDEDKVRYKYIDEVPGYEIRSSVLPGLTGIAQIYASKTASRRDKFRYDNLYIKKQSFLLDIKLILVSVFITLIGKWEAAGRKI